MPNLKSKIDKLKKTFEKYKPKIYSLTEEEQQELMLLSDRFDKTGHNSLTLNEIHMFWDIMSKIITPEDWINALIETKKEGLIVE